MKIKVVDFEDMDAGPLAIYESTCVPALGDRIRLPGDTGVWLVQERIWLPPHEEVIVVVRTRRR